MKNITSKLKKMLTQIGAFENEPCSDEENDKFNDLKDNNQPVPNDVFSNFLGKWSRLKESDLSEKELDLFIKLKQTKLLITIKNCLIILNVLIIIGLIIYVNRPY